MENEDIFGASSADIWVIKNFIVNTGAPYIKGFTVGYVCALLFTNYLGIEDVEIKTAGNGKGNDIEMH